MNPDSELDESRDRKPHPDGTLLAIVWPEHGLATISKCPLSDSKAITTMHIACMSCKHLKGFFSPGRPISGFPMQINGHKQILFQQVICEHPAVRRKDDEGG